MENADIDIKYSKIPETAKYALIVIIKGISSFPWVFFFVGLLLAKEIFFYWFIFFLFVEGLLFAALIYILVLIVKASLKTEYGIEQKHNPYIESKSDSVLEGYMKKAKSGIIGNIAFYIFLIGALVVVKFLGIFDAFFTQVFNSIGN
jgi:hypothetical protein